MNKNQKLAKEILANHKINASYYRIIILEQIIRSQNCLKIETLYNQTYKITPTISKATLYNNLSLLENNGIINKIVFSKDDVRYCLNDGNGYMYFRCKKCNGIYKIEFDENCIKNKMHGHKIEKLNTTAYGICKKCL